MVEKVLGFPTCDVCREHEEAMEVLQGDIDALEREKTELRERIKELSRKTLMEGIVRQSTAGQTSLFTGPFYGLTGLRKPPEGTALPS